MLAGCSWTGRSEVRGHVAALEHEGQTLGAADDVHEGAGPSVKLIAFLEQGSDLLSVGGARGTLRSEHQTLGSESLSSSVTRTSKADASRSGHRARA
jgi:hypothetical protein